MAPADDLKVPCLIEHFSDRPLAESVNQLSAITEVLRMSVVQYFASGSQIAPGANWASVLKRRRVMIGGHDSWGLLHGGDYDLGEIIDQCATLARLMDAMAWSQANYPECDLLLSCDPTQSDNGKADLIVASPRVVLAFEVSDVIGSAFQRKVRKQTLKLEEARKHLQGLHPKREVTCFIAMNSDHPHVPKHQRFGETAIWAIS